MMDSPGPAGARCVREALHREGFRGLEIAHAVLVVDRERLCGLARDVAGTVRYVEQRPPMACRFATAAAKSKTG